MDNGRRGRGEGEGRWHRRGKSRGEKEKEARLQQNEPCWKSLSGEMVTDKRRREMRITGKSVCVLQSEQCSIGRVAVAESAQSTECSVCALLSVTTTVLEGEEANRQM